MPQIVTLTLNPTVDITWDVEDIVPTRKLRSGGGSVHPGGGGINISRVIATLGGDSTAIFPRGGITGSLLTELLDDYAIDRQVITIRGHTRLAATMSERSTQEEYRIIPPGPDVSESEWQAVLDCIADIRCEYLVCAGSLPRGAPDDFYARIATIARDRGVKMILDTSGRALVEGLKAGVYLVKPNLRELEHLVGRKAPTPEKQVNVVQQIIEEGRADMVALTLGAEGALLVWKDGVLRLASPEVERRSAVGAGSSFVAGLTLGLAEGRPLEDAFALAVACGAAALLTPGAELCRKPDVDRLYAEIQTSRQRH
ncbi:MAG: 1-phosphofructokinase family hexose kinase [Rhodospirillales bacterium]|nr:1-phosphofructokinase family hexose kinase [Rhodospirillales bacterium]